MLCRPGLNIRLGGDIRLVALVKKEGKEEKVVGSISPDSKKLTN